MALSATQQTAVAWVEANRARLSDFNRTIWNFAEPAWREYKSARAYSDLLRAEGFAVEQGSGGMPTAFAASWGSGSPMLGSFAEYDAVPGQSQQVVPYKAPREGLHPWAAGHTDPHSSLGSAALAGILAIGIHSAGALGKLFSEVNENADMRPLEGMRAAGGNWIEAVRYGMVPQVLPAFLSYGLLRFEINVRSSTIIGFVGAGGIGQEFKRVISFNIYEEVSAIAILILIIVMLIDLASERVRARFVGAMVAR